MLAAASPEMSIFSIYDITMINIARQYEGLFEFVSGFFFLVTLQSFRYSINFYHRPKHCNALYDYKQIIHMFNYLYLLTHTHAQAHAF